MDYTSNGAKMKGKVLGVIRILLGLFMIVMGVMKMGAPAEMVGGAGAAMGMDFLSITTWFWIAVIGEIIAGLLLLSGCKKLSKIGAILTLIVMVFAVNAAGFSPNAIVVSAFALIILVLGPGCWTCCKLPCCAKGACCTGGTCCTEGTCSTGECNKKNKQQEEQQEQQ